MTFKNIHLILIVLVLLSFITSSIAQNSTEIETNDEGGSGRLKDSAKVIVTNNM